MVKINFNFRFLSPDIFVRDIALRIQARENLFELEVSCSYYIRFRIIRLLLNAFTIKQVCLVVESINIPIPL